MPDAPSLNVSSNPYDCGPETVDFLLRYWEKPADLSQIHSELYDPDQQGTLSIKLLPYFRKKKLNARLMYGNWDLLTSAVEAEIPPITMVDLDAFSPNIPDAIQKLYQGRFHFYPVIGYLTDPRSVIVADANGPNVIPWKTFRSMWKKTDRFFLLSWPDSHTPNPDGSSTIRSRYNKAIDLQDQGKLLRARKIHQRNIEENPFFGPSFGGLGELYLHQNKLKRAESYLRKAVRRDAGLYEHQNNLAWLLIKKNKKLKEAKRRIDTVIQYGIDRTSRHTMLAHAYHTRGFYHVRRKNHRNALSDLGLSHSLTTSDMTSLRTDILYRMGQVQAALNRPKEAYLSLKRALKKAEDREMKTNIQKALQQLQRTEQELPQSN